MDISFHSLLPVCCCTATRPLPGTVQSEWGTNYSDQTNSKQVFSANLLHCHAMIAAMKTHQILEIAVPVPLRRSFDYLPPTTADNRTTVIGARAQVEFGTRQLTGIITGIRHEPADINTLKHVTAILDHHSVLPGTLLPLMQWAADYYQHPIGESLATALPNALRKGQPLPDERQPVWQLSATFPGMDSIASRARQQHKALQLLQTTPQLSNAQLKTQGISTATLSALVRLGFIEQHLQTPPRLPPHIQASPLALTNEQQTVIDHYQQMPDGFQPCLLEGITGSGKTEVYLQLIARTLQQGKQALVLVPEIGLTPQTIERFQQRFDCAMAIFHSGLSDLQRLKYWQQASNGTAHIIIGTRSALFTATQNLGLIIVDEEHDLSYKQQDGLRYSARDLACIRARLENCPIILGSATPTLESLHNAISGKYHHWQLTQRAGNANPPQIDIIDIRKQPLENGIAESVLPQIQDCLDKGEQALLFINRRGFAPSLICHDCGWVGQCRACDARLTVHQQSRMLRCHHCNSTEPLPHHCPNCFSKQLVKTGTGTERLELALRQHFPDIPLFRIDRDTTSRKEALPAMMADIRQQQAAILIGTQMLAKGHHFPDVTLVVIIDADQSLVSTDYRAIERFGQLMTQVAGRAGREHKPGRALIQSHYPQHPQLIKLINWGYHRFAMDLLGERKMQNLPPFSAQALIRLEDKQAETAQHSLQQLRHSIAHLPCLCIGPYPASLQRRAWYYRYQLLIQCNNRQQLRQAVQQLLQHAETILKPHRQRWSVDIDPQDMS